MIRLTRKNKSQKAQTMVEFALVFPLILIITYGIIEFGRMVFMYAAITSSAREGARYGATALNYDNCGGIIQAIRDKSKAFLINNPTIVIKYDKGPSTTAVLCGNIDPKSIVLGDRIVVTVSTDFIPWIVFLGLKGFTITSTNARTILIDIPISYP